MDRIPFHPYDFFGYLASGLLVLIGMQLVLGFPEILGHDFEIVDGAMLLIAVYVAGQLMATPAKAVHEDFIVEKLLGQPNTLLFCENKPRVRGFLFPGFYKPFPEARRNRILEKAKAEGVEGTGEELFLHVRYNPAIANDERVISRLSGFLNQYGFSRNLSFTGLMVGFALLIKAWIASDGDLANYGLTAVVVGVMLLYRYLKFFRQYSYELFNAYAGKQGS